MIGTAHRFAVGPAVAPSVLISRLASTAHAAPTHLINQNRPDCDRRSGPALVFCVSPLWQLVDVFGKRQLPAAQAKWERLRKGREMVAAASERAKERERECKREQERARERETERETDRKRGRQKERQTERE